MEKSGHNEYQEDADARDDDTGKVAHQIHMYVHGQAGIMMARRDLWKSVCKNNLFDP